MTALVLVCSVALLASLLTFYSGFGLGTLLLPAFALFFPVDQAVALTGVVHLLNGLFKLALVRRHVDRGVLWRFGLPAVAAALVGAWLLAGLAARPTLLAWTLGGREFVVVPVKLAIGGLLIVFAALELSARFRALAFAPRWIPLGGALSGFFGGLAGMQGALRAAFLVRAGLGKEAFIATGADRRIASGRLRRRDVARAFARSGAAAGRRDAVGVRRRVARQPPPAQADDGPGAAAGRGAAVRRRRGAGRRRALTPVNLL